MGHGHACRVNMYGAFAFVKPVCALLGAPQAAALYMAGGMCSSLASHVGALLGRGGATGSLGASGAIYACAAAVAALMPDVKVCPSSKIVIICS